MSATIYLAPAALAAVLLLAVRLGDELRKRAVLVVSALGVAFGLVFMFAAQSDEIWRTAAFTGAVVCVGAAIACSWLIAGVADGGRGRWQTGVLVGVASTAAVLAAGNDWVVPALLFWTCSSLALAGLASSSPGRVAVWLAIFVSDAALVAGVIGNALETESWRVPDAITGWPLVAVLASAVVRAGALPRTGIWGVLGSGGAPGLPLLSVGAFVAVTWALGDPVPWLGVALVLVAILTAVWGLVKRELSAATVGAVPVALALGAAVAQPSASVAAGVAGAIAVTFVALWPLSVSQGAAPRALHLAFVPPTIGFLVVTAAAVAAFDRASETERIADAVVDTLFSGLLPVALAVTVALGARIAGTEFRSPAPAAEGIDDRLVSGAAWILLAASVALAIVPPDVLELAGQPLGSTGARVLLLVATGIGLAAAWVSRSKEPAAEVEEDGEALDSPEISFATLVPATEKRSGRVLAYVAVFLALAMIVSVGWFTVYGMRLGFL
jgi:hypothetical protein